MNNMISNFGNTLVGIARALGNARAMRTTGDCSPLDEAADNAL